jgi:hypothetical protein
MRNRIAVFGGDRRVERLPWPAGFEMKFFGSSHHVGTRELDRFSQAHHMVPFSLVVLLTKFVGHTSQSALRRQHVNLVLWRKGLGELVQKLPALAAQHQIYAHVENRSAEFSDAVAQSLPETSIESASSEKPSLHFLTNVIYDASPAPSTEESKMPETNTLNPPASDSASSQDKDKSSARQWSNDEIVALKLAASQWDNEELLKIFKELVPNANRSVSSIYAKLHLLFPGKTFKIQKGRGGVSKAPAPLCTQKDMLAVFNEIKPRAVNCNDLLVALKLPNNFVSKQAMRDMVRRLCRNGLVEKVSGSGHKNDPFVYRIARAKTSKARNTTTASVTATAAAPAPVAVPVVTAAPAPAPAPVQMPLRLDDAMYLVTYASGSSKEFLVRDEALAAMLPGARLWRNVKVRTVTVCDE